jgi:DNA-binding GntR family transcriptional regulator
MNAVSLNSRGSKNRSLTRVVLSEQVKEYIVEAILNGEFQPGERIVESALARELGVSQAPVREAIRDLVILGFLETEPYKGTSVRSFTTDELWEVYTVRGALESLAARLAAENLTPADGERLEAILEEMIEAGRQQDHERIARLDNDFHEAIMQVSGNQLLYQLWKTLEFGQWTIVTYKVTTLDLEYLATRHEELLEALRSGEPERAMDAMQHHLEDLGKPPKKLE